MQGILLTTLAVLAGVCLYAAVHHLWIGLRRPPQRLHWLFALLSLFAAGYVLAKLGAYSAVSAEELVALRRWEISFAVAAIGVLPWFAAAYTGVRALGPLLILSVLPVAVFVANLALPYGTSFVELPDFQRLTLPWGEQVADLRVRHRSMWFNASWVGVLLAFAFSGYACARQYRRGEPRRALTLALALGVFLAFVLFNQVVNYGLVDFIHTAEFGFIALVLLMSAALSREMRANAAALKVSEERFRTLVEQSPFSIQVLAPDGRTQQVNRAWEKLWGVKLDALDSYNILKDRQLVDKGVMPYIERGFAGEAVEIPPIVYNPAETTEVSAGPFRDRWVRAFIYPIQDEAGRVREVILMHEDVTERGRAEQTLRWIAAAVSPSPGADFFRATATQLAVLFDADYALIGVLDEPECRSITTLAVFGLGAIVENMSYPLEDTPCANVVGRSTCAYPSGVQQLFPRDHLLSDMGIEGYIGTPLFGKDGRPLGLIVVQSRKPIERVEQVREILEIFGSRVGAEFERLRAERSLRESEDRFSKTFHASPDSVTLSRLSDGRFLDVNLGFERMAGFSREEVVGKSALELGLWVEPSEREGLLAMLQTEGTVRGFEMRIGRKDGAERLGDLSAQVLEIGGERCLLAVVRDITERRRLEEKAREQEMQLIQASKMAAMGTLVSSVAHEVNNPNNLVLMNAQTLAEVWRDASRILDDHAARDGEFEIGGLPYAEMRATVPVLIRDTHDAALRIQKMVEDLRGFARPALAGAQASFEVNDAVRRAVDLLRPLIHRKTSRFSLTLADGIAPVRGDPLKVEQVVVNILVNALEALPESARAVSVATGVSDDGRAVEIRVQDEGIGIAPEQVGRVFEPFFTTKHEHGGTGLGLAICQTLVKEHGGRIDIDSAPGRGTLVRVSLPVDNPPEPESAAG